MSERELCLGCDKPVANEEEWNTVPEGQGCHLCWDDGRCLPDVEEMREEIATLRAERDELQATFDLQYKADLRAIEMFKEAHPDYPENRWPDRAALFAWVAADRAETLRERDALREALLQWQHCMTSAPRYPCWCSAVSGLDGVSCLDTETPHDEECLCARAALGES